MQKKKPKESKVAEPTADYLIRVGQSWQLQDAKARFSELFRMAMSDGPQIITRQGKDAVVLISLAVFNRLLDSRNSESIVEFFARSPLAETALNLERDKDTGRDIRI